MKYRIPRAIFLLATAILICRPPIFAQEDEEKKDPIYKPESEKTEEERKWDKTVKDVGLGNAPFGPADPTARFLSRPLLLKNGSLLRPLTWNGDFPPTTYVHFESDGLSKRIRFEYSYWDRSGSVKSLDDPYIGLCMQRGDLFVLSGDVTTNDENWFKRSGQTVIVSKESPKRDKKEWAKAAALVLHPFSAEQTVLMNGLPYEKGTLRSRAELAKMGLTSKPEAWKSVREEIGSAAGKIPIEIATKREVLKEFREGERNVLFIVAHSDSKAIFLPGLGGGKITKAELDAVKRESVPNRVIVLLACKTGAVNGETQSIAEILIKNRLASAVFASEDYIYATDLAGTLRRLQGQTTLGQVFENLRVIVEIDEPKGDWEKTEVVNASLFLSISEDNS